MAEKPVYIIGHKNPDADAICSAIAYEAFKKETGETRFQAARCGNSNKRIDAILEKFDVSLPPLITDVTPKVKDIMITKVLKAHTDSTCAEALDLIDEFDVRSLPVVDDDNRVKGLVSIFQLGEFFIPKPRETKQMRKVVTSISAIISALKARVVHTVDPEIDEDLYVRVGAMNLHSFGGFHRNEEIPASKSIIVVGDRHDIQEKSINLGVRLLVITGGLEIEKYIIDLARERGVSLIISPYDSATTSWIVRSATRLNRLLDDRFMTFHEDETVETVRRKVQQNNLPAYFVVDEEERLIGIFSRTDLLKSVGTELVLVDHNEASQAVKGVQQAKIVEVVDHHRLGNLPSEQPILFMNVPVGSTCTIVATMFERHSITPTPSIAGIMMSGIISDTLNLRGPTTTQKDHEILAWLSGIAGISADDLADLIFSSGSVILSQTPEQVVRSDCKIYNEADLLYSVAQVEELGFTNYWNKAEELDQALTEFREREGLFMSVMLVTDINIQDSLLVVSAPDDVLESFSYPKAKAGCDHILELHGIVSRKKQLIPYLTTFLQGLGINA
ncbi:MAG: putative manganese-dependent inorganic diphosphatase [Opitutales bacterium]